MLFHSDTNNILVFGHVSMFSNVGQCLSLCTTVFHCLSFEILYLRVHLAPFPVFFSFSCFSKKVRRTGQFESLFGGLLLLLLLKPDCNPDWRTKSYMPKGTSRENIPVRKRKIDRRKFYKF